MGRKKNRDKPAAVAPTAARKSGSNKVSSSSSTTHTTQEDLFVEEVCIWISYFWAWQGFGSGSGQKGKEMNE